MRKTRQILAIRSFESDAELLQWVSNASGTEVDVDGFVDGKVKNIQTFQFMLDGRVAFLLNVIEADKEAHAKKVEEMLES